MYQLKKKLLKDNLLQLHGGEYFYPLRFSILVENVTIELIMQIKNGNKEGVFLSSKTIFLINNKLGLCF